MSDPYLGEIRMFAGNFAPLGWLFCDGSLVSIAEYDALFILLGTTYGGDGVSTFALPDLRGRTPVHMGNNYPLGQSSGQELRTLTSANLPPHSHQIQVSQATGTTNQPSSSVFPAATSAVLLYNDAGNNPVNMEAASIGPAGNSSPISLMMPFLVTSFIISHQGIFPSPN